VDFKGAHRRSILAGNLSSALFTPSCAPVAVISRCLRASLMPGVKVGQDHAAISDGCLAQRAVWFYQKRFD
jgi:hypothetical protein